MLKKFLTVLLVLYSCSSVFAETLKIGLITPLSGTGASIGTYVKKGVELAVNQAEKNGSEIELFVEDDGWDIAKSVSTAQRLIALNKVDALLVVGSAVGNAVAPIAEREKVIMIAIGASDYKIARDKVFAFTHWVTPEIEANLLLKEAEKRKYEKIGIIATEQEGVIAVVNAVKSEAHKLKLNNRLVFEKFFLPNQTDFKTVILKIKKQKLDSIIL
ncbi:MAG: ABC transporter substrate-binding protein [Bdellovibrionota bacterium]